MDRVIVDAETIAKLALSSAMIAVCDEDGRVAGVFRPANRMEPLIDEAEFERRWQETEEYSTAEVVEYIEKQ